MASERLSPEEALALAEAEGLVQPAFPRSQQQRGKHRVYLGYAAGVGKTYAMLREGNRLLEQGLDVFVGILETHGRAETAAQVGALPVLPRRKIPYKGVFLEELDMEEICRRRPDWVLIDELAHTNVPGSVNKKRYQDVMAVLAEGINVLSTVNIQHVESLNDAVNRITGIPVRETFPDWVLDSADEIVTVDATPEQLHERMREGKIYEVSKAQQALKQFFRKGNLLALRELSLRRAAEETDDRLGTYREQKHIEELWPTVERVLVCITPLPGAKALIRRGWRIASRLSGELHVLFVDTGRALAEADRFALDSHFALAEELGGKTHRGKSPDVVEAILSFAKERQITQVVLGAGRPSRWEEISRGSLVDRILRRTDSLDILIVSELRKQ